MLEYAKKELKLKIINPNNYKEKARNKKFFDKALRTTFLNTYTKGPINKYDEDEIRPSFFDLQKRFINNQRILNSEENIDIKRGFQYYNIIKSKKENYSLEDYDALNKFIQKQKYQNEIYKDYPQIPTVFKNQKVEIILKKVRFHDLVEEKNQFQNQKSLKKRNKNKLVPNTTLLNYFLPIQKVLYQKNNYFTKRNSNRKILISKSQNTTKNKEPKIDIQISNKKKVVNFKSSLPLLNKYDYKNKTQNKFFIDKKDKNKEGYLNNEEINIKTKLKNEINLHNIHPYKKLINYNMISTPGSTNGRIKKNQDCYFIIPKLNNFEEIKIFGIFDGHGENGDILSNEIKDFFHNYFINLFNDGAINKNENNFENNFIIKNINSKRIFNNIFYPTKIKDKNINYSDKFKLLQDLSNKLKEKSNKIKSIYDKLTSNEYLEIFSSYKKLETILLSKYSNTNMCHLSGSTSLILFLFNSNNINKIISSNLGDSKIILISEKNTIKELNAIHTLDNSEEKKRIINKGGIIKRLHVGPLRIWFKNENYPGLSITRSFGDFESDSLGIISIPDIKEYDLDEEQIKILIFGTDGVWKFLTNEKIMDIVLPYYEYDDAEGATQKIREIANNLWNIKNPKGIADITVFVLFFK